MVALLKQLAERFNKRFTWKYFATSHGKGVVDGIGRQAKSIVRNGVLSKGRAAAIVQSSKDFA